MRRTIISVLLLTLGSGATGCGVLLPSSDTFVMIGNEEAIRAYHDSVNGLVTNAKTQDPTGNSAYWEARHEQEQARVQRVGFWQKLTQGSEATK
jgi:hypothetical protein